MSGREVWPQAALIVSQDLEAPGDGRIEDVRRAAQVAPGAADAQQPGPDAAQLVVHAEVTNGCEWHGSPYLVPLLVIR